ncbi:5'-nucleotidase C-terminal domain-containing protein [Lutispora thermophila]|uniref:5'-nucleotidase n=1 Tax=Lutispora thermophila DSM 19022 TaxID=1122184 RepID=A0A1M6B2W6_9FIRM|nr:5'-nucleotidase C-terminal domain-containing protein [Lutispora thermophila]SHI43046.1 5'-nucleotidase [Lutispora thermophila DSM 19022]
MNTNLRKKLSILVVLSMVISLVFGSFAGVYADDNKVTITIVHTNDTHSRVEAGIGFAKVAAKVKEIKAANPNTLVVDAGDTFHGQPFAVISKGESIVKIMNAIGYDVMTPGNHDFNYGQNRLLELANMAQFPIISANLLKADGTTLLNPYVIKEVGGLKIGIFGLSTPETAYKTNPKNVEGLTFADPVEHAKKMVAELKEQGADAIIALVHLGIDKESKDTSYLVRDNVEGIDLIIDGHSHSTLDSINNEGKATKIVSTGEYNNNLGIVNMTFVDGKLTSVEASSFSTEDAAALEADASVAAIIEELNAANKELTSVVVGKTDVVLDGQREHVRGGETNLSNLITDAMLAISGADMAITNGGGIRASIDVGDITMEDIITVLPFGNYVVVNEYTGAQIVAALEHGTANYPNLAGGFAQVAGVTFTLDLNEEAGKRVKDVKIGGQPIDLEKTYKVATNDFMAAGGDDYTMLKEGKLLFQLPGLDEVLIEYIKGLEAIPAEVRPRMNVIEKATAEEAVENVVTEKPTVVEPKEEAATKTYVVKPNDVLWKIAEKFGLTWEKLAEFNKLDNPHLIFPGQKLLVPAN